MNKPPNVKERRKSIRIPIMNTKAWLLDDSLELIDISETGAYIASEESIGPEDKPFINYVTVKLPGELGFLSIPCEVVRINWATTKTRKKGYAVKFLPMNAGLQKMFDSWLVYLRNHQIISVSKRIIEEFFGQDGPKL